MSDVEISSCEYWKQRVIEASEAHYADIKLIGDALIAEANDRGWCSVYDSFVDDLNKQLTISLPSREREFFVTQTYRLTRTRTIFATTTEDAGSRAEIAFHVSDLESNDWEVTDFSFSGEEIDDIGE